VKKAFAETDIYVSPPLLKEYRDVPLILETEKKLTPNQLKVLVSGLAAFVTNTVVVYPRKKLFICRDPADNMLLECCFESKADFLIRKRKRGRFYFCKKIGHNFPGETFRVLKGKEEKQYGVYRTRRVVLEAWNKLEPK
jgi:putative PIN family toxin of toxin-antitoxin system